MYFEPVCPQFCSRHFTYFKCYDSFYENISMTKGSSSDDMFKFSDIVEIQGEY